MLRKGLAIAVSDGQSYRIEPLHEAHHRSAFRCGVEEPDDYFRYRAGQDAKRKVAAVFVMSAEDGSIAGYYTLSAYSVIARELPQPVTKKLPRYPQLPATLLGRLVVSEQYRGRKLGQRQLTDAVHRSWRATSEVASIGVVVDAIDESARSFYLHHEFIPFPDHANRLFLSMGTIERLFKPRE